MSLLDFALVLLATFYVSYVMTQTKGPFGVFSGLRRLLPLGGLTECIYCLSLWVALLFCLIVLVNLSIIIYPFAAAGAAMLVYRYTGADRV